MNNLNTIAPVTVYPTFVTKAPQKPYSPKDGAVERQNILDELYQMVRDGNPETEHSKLLRLVVGRTRAEDEAELAQEEEAMVANFESNYNLNGFESYNPDNYLHLQFLEGRIV